MTVEQMTAQWVRPTTVSGALNYLASTDEQTHIVAGGTDLMLQVARAEVSPYRAVALSAIETLKAVTIDDGIIEIGAMASHDDVFRALRVHQGLSAVTTATRSVGSWQTQNAGTVMGNVCNASPAADTVPALLVHDASIHLASASASRDVPLEDFIVDRRRTTRRPEEIALAIRFDSAEHVQSRSSFVKVGRRGAMDISVVNVACRMTFTGSRDDFVIDSVALAVGACTPVPYRARGAEKVLEGMGAGSTLESAAREASLMAVADANPISDVRATENYRKLVLPRVVYSSLRQCIDAIISRPDGM